MEYDDTERDLNLRYVFMMDKMARSTFAKLDYLLRSGMHIQRDFPKPVSLYNFLEKYYISLQAYYDDFFEMLLKKEGEGWNTYFFIDFHENSRGRIPADNSYRYYLKPEYVLVGLIFFKIFKLDGNIELAKISEFINLLYQEYDELLHKMQRVVSSIEVDAGSDRNEEKLKTLVHRAFGEFEQLGWIARDTNDNDYFTYQPSFERLRRIYYPQIETIDEIIKRKEHG
jgi:chromosome condensin MukBEF MukE localization factor